MSIKTQMFPKLTSLPAIGVQIFFSKYLFRTINELKSKGVTNSNQNGDSIPLKRCIESLQAELDLHTSNETIRVKELTEMITNLTDRNEKLEDEIKILEKPETMEVGIQSDNTTQSDSEVIQNLNQMVDHLNKQISEMRQNHENEISNIVVRKYFF